MPWLEAAAPVRMERVALVAPAGALRDVLAVVADSGAMEIDLAMQNSEVLSEAARRLRTAGQAPPAPALSPTAPDLAALAADGRYDLLAGEAELDARSAEAVRRAGAAALAGWIPASRAGELAQRIGALGGTLVPLRHPRGAMAPTLLDGAPLKRSLTPLVRTYGVMPSVDIDPTWLAWASYVLMFGMMFGDVGHGALLILAAVALRAGWPRWIRRWRTAWLFVAGAGVAATGFGLLYGECFGPTGLVPTLWLNPLEAPIPLLMTAIAIGAVLLAGAYALGTVNRWREGGWPLALYAPSGIAGTSLFLGIAVAAGGWYIGHVVLLTVGLLIAAAGLTLAFIGFFAEAGGGGTGVAQASVELFDLVIRLGSNVVSFARLAAFGLTHAALSLVVWDASRGLWHRGGAVVIAAAVVFVIGNLLAFALEALIAAIQALRLEYYELFSRVFQVLGREFKPWHVPLVTAAAAAGVPGAVSAAGGPAPAAGRPTRGIGTKPPGQPERGQPAEGGSGVGRARPDRRSGGFQERGDA